MQHWEEEETNHKPSSVVSSALDVVCDGCVTVDEVNTPSEIYHNPHPKNNNPKKETQKCKRSILKNDNPNMPPIPRRTSSSNPQTN
eukprot:9644636-Ditylum_brightwellii.AAC.1